MNDKVDNFDDKLEAMSIAMSEWQRLEHMSLEDLENKRTDFKTPWTVGNYKISVTLGEQGKFADGSCSTTASGDEKNCFKDTTMTVYDKDGKAIYSTRTLPLSSGGDSDGGALKITGYKLVGFTGSNCDEDGCSDTFGLEERVYVQGKKDGRVVYSTYFPKNAIRDLYIETPDAGWQSGSSYGWMWFGILLNGHRTLNARYKDKSFVISNRNFSLDL